jgi:hypothetical protein
MAVAAFLVGGYIGVQLVVIGLATYGLGMWGRGKKR